MYAKPSRADKKKNTSIKVPLHASKYDSTGLAPEYIRLCTAFWIGCTVGWAFDLLCIDFAKNEILMCAASHYER